MIFISNNKINYSKEKTNPSGKTIYLKNNNISNIISNIKKKFFKLKNLKKLKKNNHKKISHIIYFICIQ